MATHDAIVAPPAIDRASAELSAHERLVAAHEVLAQVVQGASIRSMQDHGLLDAAGAAEWTAYFISIGKLAEAAPTIEEVYAAASFVFRAVHEDLARVGEGAMLWRDARRALWERREQARRGLEDVATRAQAKAVQRRAGAGRPLAVCFGRRARRIPELAQFGKPDSCWVEDVCYLPHGDGCGTVFVDSTRDFARYCPKCRKKPGGYFVRKAIATRTAVYTARVPVPRYDLDGNRVAAWRATCTACGERFETLEPRVKRCARCRAGHRTASHFMRTWFGRGNKAS